MPIPEVIQLLEKIKTIHEKKNQDYAAPGKDFENFERSAEIASWFDKEIDKAFTILIGTKLARLATLLNADNAGLAKPNNESIDDSFLDLATYCILWGSNYQRRNLLSSLKGLIKEIKPSDVSYPAGVSTASGQTIVHRCEWCNVAFSFTPTIYHGLVRPHYFDSDKCCSAWMNHGKKSPFVASTESNQIEDRPMKSVSGEDSNY